MVLTQPGLSSAMLQTVYEEPCEYWRPSAGRVWSTTLLAWRQYPVWVHQEVATHRRLHTVRGYMGFGVVVVGEGGVEGAAYTRRWVIIVCLERRLRRGSGGWGRRRGWWTPPTYALPSLYYILCLLVPLMLCPEWVAVCVVWEYNCARCYRIGILVETAIHFATVGEFIEKIVCF